MHPADTIAAIATARGRAALAIVRLSGPAAVALADRHLPSRDLAAADSHTAHVGFFTAPDGVQLDQVVVTLFRAPRSATGEDVVEISCHGGDLAPQQILRALLDDGARLARPGEFTERAFLNGKLDLAQAEAVADLIHAQSSLAHRVSVNHLQGRYSDEIAAVRDELLQACALIELELDFAEEDVEFADTAQLTALLDRTEALLTQLLGSYRLGTLARDGVRVVIGGRPNAGKSTLLNALAGRDRAIVSPIPGTTRDEIEAEVELAGLTFRFVDTAGLRETADAVEAEGVRRTHAALERCDAVLYVYDATVGLDQEEDAWLRRLVASSSSSNGFTVKPQRVAERREALGERSDDEVQRSRPPLLLVGNKADLLGRPSDAPKLTGSNEALSHVSVSAHEALDHPASLTSVFDWLTAVVASGLSGMEATPIVVSHRHRQHLAAALDALYRAQTAVVAGQGGETLAFDLRVALHELGSITGEITNEDILGTIFSRFCIGK